MTYAMVLATVGALLLSAPALAAPSHGQAFGASKVTFNSHDSRSNNDRERDEMFGDLDKEMHGILHNPHCDPDDRNGPDGDRDDRAANNPGRGRHVGRCIGKPASPSRTPPLGGARRLRSEGVAPATLPPPATG